MEAFHGLPFEWRHAVPRSPFRVATQSMLAVLSGAVKYSGARRQGAVLSGRQARVVELRDRGLLGPRRSKIPRSRGRSQGGSRHEARARHSGASAKKAPGKAASQGGKGHLTFPGAIGWSATNPSRKVAQGAKLPRFISKRAARRPCLRRGASWVADTRSVRGPGADPLTKEACRLMAAVPPWTTYHSS